MDVPNNERRLEPHQLIIDEKDRQTLLPLRLTRAEAKLFYGFLLCSLMADQERGVVNQKHRALAMKLYYYITDTPLSSQS
jgi:hypothetical protein